jgi:hypothetical protein
MADDVETKINEGTLTAAPQLANIENDPDFEAYKDVMTVRAEFLGQPPQRNYRYEKYPYHGRLFPLSIMNRSHTLVEMGDIDRYMAIDDKINALPKKSLSKPDIIIRKMMEWLKREMAAVKKHKTVSTKGKVVITMLTWGKEYADKTLNYSFKSMMADGNLPVLCKSKFVIMYVQTNEEGRAHLEASPIVAAMKEIGVHFEYTLVDPEVLAGIAEGREELYWMVGAAASLAIHYAKKNGAAFHHSYPDCLYSDHYFYEILRLAAVHKNILIPCATADETTLFPLLQPYEDEKKIAVPAADLVALTLNAVHLTLWTMMVNNRPSNWLYPQNYVLLWESEDQLHINSPHVNAAWICEESLAATPDRFFRTLDSELDMLCPGYDFYIPQETDNIYMAGLASQSRYSINDFFVTEKETGAHIWRNVGHRDLMKFFFNGAKFRINREVRPMPANAIPNPQIAAEKTYLFNSIMCCDPYAGVQFAQPRTDASGVFASVR